jgi:WD40 repeat protein
VLAGHTDRVTACAISPAGDYVASASDDEACRVWDSATGVERAAIYLPDPRRRARASGQPRCPQACGPNEHMTRSAASPA